jgi:hypothetical protein
MTIRESISDILSRCAPLMLVKQIFPSHVSTHDFVQHKSEHKPWLNVDKITLTAEDFA